MSMLYDLLQAQAVQKISRAEQEELRLRLAMLEGQMDDEIGNSEYLTGGGSDGRVAVWAGAKRIVSYSGFTFTGSALTITPLADSTSTFAVRNAAGTSLFYYDSTNGQAIFNAKSSGATINLVFNDTFLNKTLAGIWASDGPGVTAWSNFGIKINSAGGYRDMLAISGGRGLFLCPNSGLDGLYYGYSDYSNPPISYDIDFDGTMRVTSAVTLDSTLSVGDDVTLADGANIIVNATTGTKIGTSTSQKLGFYNAAPVVQPSALTTGLTAITHSAAGTPDYAIQDPASGGYGFVTLDEALTVLAVIANLQTRVDELEDKLQALGLLA